MKSVCLGEEVVRLLHKSEQRLNADEEKLYGEYALPCDQGYWPVKLVKAMLRDSETGIIFFPETQVKKILLGVKIAYRHCQWLRSQGRCNPTIEDHCIGFVVDGYNLSEQFSQIQEQWGSMDNPNEKAREAFAAYESKMLSIKMAGGDC